VRVTAALRGLGDDRGLTLMELIVGATISTVVLLGAMNFYDATVRGSTRITDRVDASQRARVGLDQAVRQLRGAACPSGGYGQILYADATRVVFHTDSDNDGVYDPEVHEIDIVPGGTGRVNLVLRSYTGTSSATPPVTGAPGAPPSGWTPYVDRLLISDLAAPPVGGFPGGTPLPVLQYFDISDQVMATPVAGQSLDAIAHINLNVAVNATNTGTKDAPIRLQDSAYALRTDRTASTDLPTFSC
jgi:hypothetical protein